MSRTPIVLALFAVAIAIFSFGQIPF